MAESASPKGSSGVFAKKVQRQLSRGKEKVLQRLGKNVESKDDEFEHFLQNFSDQQSDGNRIHKDLRSYINAVRDMREASRRLSQSLFDVYEPDWAGEEDLGPIVEGEDLLWNDYEVKLLDQAVRTMESYVSQFPDVREKVAKRGRKLVDYDSARHHLEALQTAKKKDDVKINKAEEELNAAKSVYEGINNELKDELPVLHESRIGCYVSVFSSVSNLRDIFYKEMSTLNVNLQNVMKELQAQHPDKVFSLKELQRYGSLKRRTLSPKLLKVGFSEFHRSFSPLSSQRFSFRSPDKARSGTLSREGSTRVSSQRSSTRDADAELKPEEGSSHVDEEKGLKNEESEPPAESDNERGAEKAAESGSRFELKNSSDSGSLELKHSAVDNGPLHIEESEDTPKPNGLDNGEVSGCNSDAQELDVPQKNAAAESKNTVV
ncbi:bridging integrator 2a [Scomber japonicus]|uniref:bridging integrator 2a n=1 Tax=Scomber japonicus TaxID=13676 RepID=UPI0023060489|nr:bridging integrator 2a [Scomber japonicus]